MTSREIPGVRLEPWAEGDLPLLTKLLGDPEMTVHLGGPESAEKLAERQAKYERLPDSGTGWMFKIVDEETGEAVGSVGYWDKTWREQEVYETGWSVLPAFQGRGIAVEATNQAIELGEIRREASLPARLPVGRKRGVERDLPEARLHAARRGRVRIPAGPPDAVQRLAARPAGLRAPPI